MARLALQLATEAENLTPLRHEWEHGARVSPIGTASFTAKVSAMTGSQLAQESLGTRIAKISPRALDSTDANCHAMGPVQAGSGDLYALAGHLCRTSAVAVVIDVGCNLDPKRSPSFGVASYVGLGDATQIRAARLHSPDANFIEVDLAKPIELDAKLLAQAVVICHDTVMRQHGPEVLMTSLVQMACVAPWLLVSLAVETQSSGDVSLMGQAKASLQQFEEFVALCGGRDPMMGFVDGCNGHGQPRMMMAILGAHARPPTLAPQKSVLAIVSCYNDEDFITKTIEHLVSQEVSIWVIDNWSTDGTWEILERLRKKMPASIVGLERFPADAPASAYKWQQILARKEAIARSANYDWFIHYDSDELRVSPWPNVTLRDALSAVDALGYNAVDHTVLNFRPIRDGFGAQHAVDDYFTHCEFSRAESGFLQIKAWAKQTCPISLGALGGHFVSYPGIKVYPLKFLLKHFSLRSSAQAKKKIHQDRLPRIDAEESALGWHSHYRRADAEAATRLDWEKEFLFIYDSNTFNQHFIIERLSGINAKSVPYRIVL